MPRYLSIDFLYKAVQDDLLLISQRQVPVPRNLKTLENHIAFTSNKPSLVGYQKHDDIDENVAILQASILPKLEVFGSNTKEQYRQWLYVPSSNPSSQDSLDDETLLNLFEETIEDETAEVFVAVQTPGSGADSRLLEDPLVAVSGVSHGQVSGASDLVHQLRPCHLSDPLAATSHVTQQLALMRSTLSADFRRAITSEDNDCKMFSEQFVKNNRPCMEDLQLEALLTVQHELVSDKEKPLCTVSDGYPNHLMAQLLPFIMDDVGLEKDLCSELADERTCAPENISTSVSEEAARVSLQHPCKVDRNETTSFASEAKTLEELLSTDIDKGSYWNKCDPHNAIQRLQVRSENQLLGTDLLLSLNEQERVHALVQQRERYLNDTLLLLLPGYLQCLAAFLEVTLPSQGQGYSAILSGRHLVHEIELASLSQVKLPAASLDLDLPWDPLLFSQSVALACAKHDTAFRDRDDSKRAKTLAASDDSLSPVEDFIKVTVAADNVRQTTTTEELRLQPITNNASNSSSHSFIVSKLYNSQAIETQTQVPTNTTTSNSGIQCNSNNNVQSTSAAATKRRKVSLHNTVSLIPAQDLPDVNDGLSEFLWIRSAPKLTQSRGSIPPVSASHDQNVRSTALPVVAMETTAPPPSDAGCVNNLTDDKPVAKVAVSETVTVTLSEPYRKLACRINDEVECVVTSLRVDGWLGAFDTFSTLTVAGVDEALRAYEKSRLRQSHVTTISDSNIVKCLSTLRELLVVQDVLVTCCFEDAIDMLKALLECRFDTLMTGLLDSVRQLMHDSSCDMRKRKVLHPKVRVTCDIVRGALVSASGTACDINRVLVVIGSGNNSRLLGDVLLAALSLVGCVKAAKLTSNTVDELCRHNCWITTDNHVTLDHLPWQLFSHVIDYQIGYCNENVKKLCEQRMINFYTVQLTNTTSLSAKNPTAIIVGHMTVVAYSHWSTQHASLIHILEARYNIDIVMRNYTATARKQRDPDLAVSERTAVLLCDLDKAEQAGDTDVLQCRLVTLSSQYSLCYIIASVGLTTVDSSSSVTVAPRHLRRYVSLHAAVVTVSKAISSFTIKVLLAVTVSDVAATVYSIAAKDMQDLALCTREGIVPTEQTPEESFLLAFPCINVFSANVLLQHCGHLYQLLALTFQQLQDTYSTIPPKVLQEFHRYVNYDNGLLLCHASHSQDVIECVSTPVCTAHDDSNDDDECTADYDWPVKKTSRPMREDFPKESCNNKPRSFPPAKCDDHDLLAHKIMSFTSKDAKLCDNEEFRNECVLSKPNAIHNWNDKDCHDGSKKTLSSTLSHRMAGARSTATAKQPSVKVLYNNDTKRSALKEFHFNGIVEKGSTALSNELPIDSVEITKRDQENDGSNFLLKDWPRQRQQYDTIPRNFTFSPTAPRMQRSEASKQYNSAWKKTNDNVSANFSYGTKSSSANFNFDFNLVESEDHTASSNLLHPSQFQARHQTTDLKSIQRLPATRAAHHHGINQQQQQYADEGVSSANALQQSSEITPRKLPRLNAVERHLQELNTRHKMIAHIQPMREQLPNSSNYSNSDTSLPTNANVKVAIAANSRDNFGSSRIFQSSAAASSNVPGDPSRSRSQWAQHSDHNSCGSGYGTMNTTTNVATRNVYPSLAQKRRDGLQTDTTDELVDFGWASWQTTEKPSKKRFHDEDNYLQSQHKKLTFTSVPGKTGGQTQLTFI